MHALSLLSVAWFLVLCLILLEGVIKYKYFSLSILVSFSLFPFLAVLGSSAQAPGSLVFGNGLVGFLLSVVGCHECITRRSIQLGVRFLRRLAAYLWFAPQPAVCQLECAVYAGPSNLRNFFPIIFAVPHLCP